ncbi:MAG: 2-oxoacid:ferredoxin oxidoreductase subunit beta [Limnochordia bacterium]|nr:2-oxoacid:ferredoxin oxidoreductase subunit beta [Limnochordia bacterium]MDI9464208.1 2-oxoacid:ferredoxin oxidoreductase subunit beta [Bacillota bacterium]HAN95603.1 2-oxoacid ferredoxin oxidoreductase [Bacillota bacterium]HOB41387.1 2-oxoacid:ferredoxin oxidoreductase subunit beta [Limnochordia bacterium]HOK32263.1 2-oxoacid:ferredoxin oxidoreductase subunit beta [Limnochordia bacterium]
MAEQGFVVSRETAWCPGCGNFGIVRALAKALSELGLKPQEVLFVSGIGQAGKLPHYISGNVLNTLHGRTLPTATGAKLANSDLTVIAVGGDGDGYAEGGNHFLHAIRRNVDITYIVHDNQVFGLTKGQASPRSDRGMVTGTTPLGAYNEPFNPLATAITLNAGFVARSFAGDQEHLARVLKAAIQHKGFALVDVLQPCVTFNRINTYQFYRSRVYDLDQEAGYDRSDRQAAWARSWEWGERIPIGIFYQVERPTLTDHFGDIVDVPLVKQELARGELVEELLHEFRVG